MVLPNQVTQDSNIVPLLTGIERSTAAIDLSQLWKEKRRRRIYVLFPCSVFTFCAPIVQCHLVISPHFTSPDLIEELAKSNT